MYLTFKALHIISVICWMAGMLYLPRLFVYHAKAAPGSELSETLKVMERRLARYIMLPAMVASWVFGLALIHMNPGWMAQGWLHMKLLLVLALSGVHGMLVVHVKHFARDENRKNDKFFRIINEIPTIIMIVSVLLVVFKPF